MPKNKGSMANISKPRRGLPRGHPPTENPPLDEGLLDSATDLLGRLATANKAFAERRINSIVAWHQNLRVLDENPVRTADLKNNLTCVKNSAKALRSHIAALDYESLRRLRQHGMFEHASLIEPIVKKQRRGDEFDTICERRDSRLLSMLDLIVKASERALAELPTDPGGTKKQSILGGTANEELVPSCHKLFQLYRPGEATTSDDGDFHAFCSYVYELSTGEEDEDLGGRIREHFKKIKQSRQGG